MKLLLDSHTLIWAVDEPVRLSPIAATALRTKANDLLLSAATVWELSIKHGLKKLSLSAPFRAWMEQAMKNLDLELLPITVDYAAAQAALPPHHGDPFDRLLAAQSLTDQIPIVSGDAVFDRYGVTRLW